MPDPHKEVPNDMDRADGKIKEELRAFLNSLLAPALEIAALDMLPSGAHPKFCVYIERLDGQAIGIEDCVKATHLINEPLDNLPLMQTLFPHSYELEVSSPGIDRLLDRAQDYVRFTGSQARIQTTRPLTGEELGNMTYGQKNPKQKHFLGKLHGIQDGNLILVLTEGTKKKKVRTNSEEDGITALRIPLPLIARAHLESLDQGSAPKKERDPACLI